MPERLRAGFDGAGEDLDVVGTGPALSGEVYARPLHHEPVFASLVREPLPVAEDVCARQICLPIHSDMTEGEASTVVSALEHVITRQRA